MKVTKETPTNKKVKLKKTIKNKSPPEKKSYCEKKNVKGEVCNRRFQKRKKKSLPSIPLVSLSFLISICLFYIIYCVNSAFSGRSFARYCMKNVK